jgi:hypothetical protein
VNELDRVALESKIFKVKNIFKKKEKEKKKTSILSLTRKCFDDF